MDTGLTLGLRRVTRELLDLFTIKIVMIIKIYVNRKYGDPRFRPGGASPDRS